MGKEQEHRIENALDRSPILTSFLDPTYKTLLTTLKNTEPYMKAAREKIGQEKINEVVNPLAVKAFVSRTFSLNTNAVQTFKIVELLVLAGYEVGNRDDIMLFKEEILKKLGKLKVFTGGRQYLEEESTFVMGTFFEGVKLKAPPTPVNDPWLKPFEAYFKGRDIDLP